MFRSDLCNAKLARGWPLIRADERAAEHVARVNAAVAYHWRGDAPGVRLPMPAIASNFLPPCLPSSKVFCLFRSEHTAATALSSLPGSHPHALR